MTHYISNNGRRFRVTWKTICGVTVKHRPPGMRVSAITEVDCSRCVHIHDQANAGIPGQCDHLDAWCQRYELAPLVVPESKKDWIPEQPKFAE